jgi:ATP-dependent DNA helicase RecG
VLEFDQSFWRERVQQEELRQLLDAGESEWIEFKRAVPRPDHLLRNLVALANSRGGHLILGVDEAGRVIGVDVDPNALRQTIQHIASRADPALEVTADVLMLDERPVVVVTVPRGWHGPYTIAGTGEVYVRRGSISSAAGGSDLVRVALESALGAFEDAPVEQASLADIDASQFRRYLARRGAGLVPGPDLVETMLRNLGFAAPAHFGASHLVPTVAALLLFGVRPQQFLPQARVEITRFTKEGSGDAAELVIAEATLPEQIEQALGAFERMCRQDVGASVDGTDRGPEYPQATLRELLLNALIHRDYSVRGASVQLRVYPERWEIVSPGRFPGSPPRVGSAQERVARNPRLSEAMRILGYGEGLGLGLARASASLAAVGYPEPSVREGSTSVTVTLAGWTTVARRRALVRRFRDDLVREGGRARLLHALDYLLSHDTLTNAEYRRLTGVSEVTSLRDLRDLVERGFLVRYGAKRGAFYALADGAGPCDTRRRDE